MKKIDVAILLYRPEELFYKSLKRILCQNLVPDNIFLIITECKEFDSEMLKCELDKRGLFNDKILIKGIERQDFNHGNTRRMAADMSVADYMVFMTQDAVPQDKKLIQSLYDSLKNKNIAVSYARQVPSKDAKIIERFSRSFNYPKVSETRSACDLSKKGIKAIFCSDTCAMYNLRIYRELGGFAENVDFNEDELFAYKALTGGYQVHYCAESSVIHSHNFSLKQHYERSVEIAKSQKQHSEIFANISSESEGIKYAKAGVKYIAKHGSFFDLIYFIIYCGVRFIGFRVGKR